MSDEAEETIEPRPTLIPIPVLDRAPEKDTPRFMVVDDTFIAQTDEGEVRVALKVPTRLLVSMEAALTYLDELKLILEDRGETAILELLDELDIIDTREFARKFSQAYREKEDARLGESFTSSN